MNILALNPFHGGSHRAFLEGWIGSSRHVWTMLTQPDRHWKWRMRHAAVTFAQQIRDQEFRSEDFNVIFATDMLNLAEFKGLLPVELRHIPILLYFHENQLTYPNQESRERDLHFGMTNVISAMAADAVWFNSKYHRDVFLQAVEEFHQRMPAGLPTGITTEIASKSDVFPPGIEFHNFENVVKRDDTIHIVWVARWEHDKNPEEFFAALNLLKDRGVDFRVSVAGQSYDQQPDCFEFAKQQLADHIVHWGYVKDRNEYWQLLREADVFVSTAHHEFFGISAIEAMVAGCIPVLPHRLSYPELVKSRNELLYDGGVESLARRLQELANLRHHNADEWIRRQQIASRLAERFQWNVVCPKMDEALIDIAKNSPFNQ